MLYPVLMQEEAEAERVEFLEAAGDKKDTSKGADDKAAGKAVEPSLRVTTRYMTKYEKARILGTRALQLR